jgi:hypothetical protein
MNMGAYFLAALGILVLGSAFLVALGLAIAGKTRAAVMTFAVGLLGAAVIASLASLSFLQKGMGFYEEGSEPGIALTVLALLLAGAGQFVAALRKSGAYGVALACAAGSMLLLAAPLLGMDALRWNGVGHVLSVSSLSLPWLTLGRAVSLLLAVAGVSIAILPSQRWTGALVGIMLAALGGIAGFAAGDALVTTHTTLLQSFPGGGPQGMRVEVDVFGRRVSDETGFAPIPREGLSLVRAVSLAQVAWVFGPPLLGAGAGLVAAWGIGRSLVRFREKL